MLTAIDCYVPLADILPQIFLALDVLERNRLGDTAAADAVTLLALAAAVR